MAKKIHVKREEITSSIYIKDECYIIRDDDFNYKNFTKNKTWLWQNPSTVYYREYLVNDKRYKVVYEIKPTK
ncbi:hypothetical protein EB1_28320 [Empedobacter brevis NBRC 14943 = ATCC 43319]|uniref:Uncharacterized protein n=1 Tax=Empedobacter brevis NBRC 14943 = ATCC 43319 TaxID=1218108 RepID=A0A511NJQ9_9FLAO|nr:hypothetical protein EB1_28320 [Empedobacter brevis NBRC 14943 = ATCC 43319]